MIVDAEAATLYKINLNECLILINLVWILYMVGVSKVVTFFHLAGAYVR